MPAIYTRGGHALNENILLKIFAFDDSASDARTPCIAKGWEAVRRGPPLLISVPITSVKFALRPTRLLLPCLHSLVVPGFVLSTPQRAQFGGWGH